MYSKMMHFLRQLCRQKRGGEGMCWCLHAVFCHKVVKYDIAGKGKKIKRIKKWCPALNLPPANHDE